MTAHEPSSDAPQPSVMRGVLGLLFIIALPALAVLAIPYALIEVGRQKIRDKRALDRMQIRGRFRNWDEIQPDLNAGRGTLIVAMAQKQGASVWWTAEDVATTSPMPVTQVDELNYFDMLTPNSDPFVQWCHDTYVDEETGRAKAVNTPRHVWKGCYGFDHNFRKMFPKLCVIETVRIIGTRSSPPPESLAFLKGSHSGTTPPNEPSR